MIDLASGKDHARWWMELAKQDPVIDAELTRISYQLVLNLSDLFAEMRRQSTVADYMFNRMRSVQIYSRR